MPKDLSRNRRHSQVGPGPAAASAPYSVQDPSTRFDNSLQQAKSLMDPSTIQQSSIATTSGSRASSEANTRPSPSSSLAHALHPVLTPPTASENDSGPTSQQSQSSPPTVVPEASGSREGPSTDQPLTSHGKPRERVYLACVQCRNRKVRCDGTKPECFNCVKRADPNAGPCSYDSAPRRRGKDRKPGSRRLAAFDDKPTRTTRSRYEEESKRKKSEAVKAAFAALADPEPAQHLSGSQAAYSGHAQTYPISTQTGDATTKVPPLLLESSNVPSAPARSVIYSGYNDLGTPHLVIPALVYVHPDALRLAQLVEEEEDTNSDTYYSNVTMPPGMQFARETWWDALLSSYALGSLGGGAESTLSVSLRETTTTRITADLRFFFKIALHWFSFIHVPRFFGSLMDPYRRRAMQPSLVLAALALSIFSRSSELENGSKGRTFALEILEQAHATFDASFNAGWIDVGLVQAAWLLAIFEMQAHPKSNTARSRSAFRRLDSLIHSLQLTMLDINDPRVSVFAPNSVPIVPSASVAAPDILAPSSFAVFPVTGIDDDLRRAFGTPVPLSPAPIPVSPASITSSTPPPPAPLPHLHNQHTNLCGCNEFSLGAQWPQARTLTPAWTNMPMWPPDASEGELQKEECRRLVWCTVMLTVSHSSKTTAGTDREPQPLWIKDPANYALLFPGENFTPPGMVPVPSSSKDSIWALYMRTLFLWNSCLRARGDPGMSQADRAQYAMCAWLELDSVEAAMDRHMCDIQGGFMLQMREVLFNTRMVVSNEFRRYIPEALTASGRLFYHEKAKLWMTHLLHLAHAFRQGQLIATKGHATANTRRNFMMYWFMSNILRGLSLWYADPSLKIALEVAKAFAPCVEFMMMIWPSPSQRREYEGLRHWLVRTCNIAGIPPPERAIPVPPSGSSTGSQTISPPTQPLPHNPTPPSSSATTGPPPSHAASTSTHPAAMPSLTTQDPGMAGWNQAHVAPSSGPIPPNIPTSYLPPHSLPSEQHAMLPHLHPAQPLHPLPHPAAPSHHDPLQPIIPPSYPQSHPHLSGHVPPSYPAPATQVTLPTQPYTTSYSHIEHPDTYSQV